MRSLGPDWGCAAAVASQKTSDGLRDNGVTNNNAGPLSGGTASSIGAKAGASQQRRRPKTPSLMVLTDTGDASLCTTDISSSGVVRPSCRGSQFLREPQNAPECIMHGCTAQRQGDEAHDQIVGKAGDDSVAIDAALRRTALRPFEWGYQRKASQASQRIWATDDCSGSATTVSPSRSEPAATQPSAVVWLPDHRERRVAIPNDQGRRTLRQHRRAAMRFLDSASRALIYWCRWAA